MDDADELVISICTQVGMIMEDASIVALTIGGLSGSEKSNAIAELGVAAENIWRLKSLASKLRHVRDDKAPHEELVEILGALQIDPFTRARADLKDRLTSAHRGEAAIRRIPIRVTTVQSSKGLAADLVCITYLDDQYVIKNADKSLIGDQDVCNFLVALTRARKKVLLASSAQKDPTFLCWIARLQPWS